jgi:hypothetical protein
MRQDQEQRRQRTCHLGDADPIRRFVQQHRDEPREQHHLNAAGNQKRRSARQIPA